jgi:hypothetical protein
MKEPIPGERDPTTEAPTERGIVGTTGYGVDLPADATADPTLTDDDRRKSRWEGGGRTGETGPKTRHPDNDTLHRDK